MTKIKCPECLRTLKKSKLNVDVWVCKFCNILYQDEEVNKQKTLKNFNLKTKGFDNIYTKRNK